MNSSQTTSGSLERQLFVRALELPAGKERTHFLDEACAGKPELRHRLDLLLHRFESLGSFLEESAVPSPNSPAKQISSEVLTETVSVAAGSEKAGDRIGRYKLLQQIGEGGCGVVYKGSSGSHLNN